jgi:Protein of unknown function (DUF3775)
MPELRINPDKVCELIDAAQEVAGLEPSTAGDATSTGDDSALETLVEPEEGEGMDPRRVEMIEVIAGLNAAEQTDFLALIMLGRGDYDIDEWDEAVIAARDAIDDRSADFMIGDPALPAYLREALDAFGKSCPDL